MIERNAASVISLSQGKIALIDKEDLEKIAQYKWYALKRGNICYAIAHIRISPHKRTTLYMHRLIAQVLPNQDIDHINCNGLDNRRINLRIATQQENNFNMRPRNGTSSYKGVHWHSQSRHWRSQITLNGRHISLGLFKNEIDAAQAYNAAAKHLFGDFAHLNQIKTRKELKGVI